MPAGATNTVGLTDDGKRGHGVFIYRDAIGHGANDFKGVKLRWLHAERRSGKVDPAKAAVKVHAIAMVYVPEGRSRWARAPRRGSARFRTAPTMPVDCRASSSNWAVSRMVPGGAAPSFRSWWTRQWNGPGRGRDRRPPHRGRRRPALGTGRLHVLTCIRTGRCRMPARSGRRER